MDNFAIAKNETEALQKIQETNLDAMVVLEETPQKKSDNYSYDNSLETDEDVSIVEMLPGYWKFNVKNNADQFLVINQENYPGWVATIDGAASKIYQADYLFQAISVPGGKHEVIVKYESKPLIIGAILSIIGLSFVLAVALYEFFIKRKPRKNI